MTYDLIIIGAGPAGISAAIYAKRSNLNVLVLEKYLVGGLVYSTNIIENIPGMTNITGPDLTELYNKQLKELDIPLKKEEVIKIEPNKVITKKGEYQTRNILIATGRSPRKLGLANEEELFGKGISYCAVCDAPFFKNKVVAVVGAGNSALEEADYIANYASKVIILNRGMNIRAENYLQDRINQKDNIEIRYETKVTEIKGSKKLESIIINDKEELKIDGLFIYIGYTPKTDFIEELNITDKQGYIEVNNKQETKIKGIYAAGDITKKDLYQIVTAYAEGAKAVVNIYKEGLK